MTGHASTSRVRYLDEAWPERWFYAANPHMRPLWTLFRRLPWFRKFYWTQAEIDAGRERAAEFEKLWSEVARDA